MRQFSNMIFTDTHLTKRHHQKKDFIFQGQSLLKEKQHD